CKIQVPGHQDVSDKNCQKFFHVVNTFLRDNRQNGIHCTHGINRSGYFIVRYLIEILGQQPDNAIAGKFLLFVSSSSSSSDQEDDDYYMERDRPLPYSRPSIDPTLNDISSDTSKILV
ncbi:unnamed protein product, partial [Rotaria sp. Silwood1]